MVSGNRVIPFKLGGLLAGSMVFQASIEKTIRVDLVSGVYKGIA